MIPPGELCSSRSSDPTRIGSSSSGVASVSFHRLRKPNSEITPTISTICSSVQYLRSSANIASVTALTHQQLVISARNQPNARLEKTKHRYARQFSALCFFGGTGRFADNSLIVFFGLLSQSQPRASHIKERQPVFSVGGSCSDFGAMSGM